MSRKYVLNEHGEPEREDNVLVWGHWMERAENRTVAKTKVGQAMVSTVFLGLDHDFRGMGPPVLWETMVFDPPDGDERQQRYTSRAAAEAGHIEVVEQVQAALGEAPL